MTLRDSPCGDTSKAATVAVSTHDVSLPMETNIILFEISSETPHVTTAGVTVFDVTPYGLSRHVKYRCSFSAGQSSCTIGNR